MQAIVHQLGELFLQAVPTVLIILLFYFTLRALFFKPLLAVIAERDSRTVGAQKASEAAQAAAAQKVKQYQEALRQARGQVYAEQEAARKKLLGQRAAQIKDARTRAASEVSVAKARVATDLSAARRDVEATVAQLSAEIARRILQVPPRPGAPAREARCLEIVPFSLVGACYSCCCSPLLARRPQRKAATRLPSEPRRSSSGLTLSSLPACSLGSSANCFPRYSGRGRKPSVPRSQMPPMPGPRRTRSYATRKPGSRIYRKKSRNSALSPNANLPLKSSASGPPLTAMRRKSPPPQRRKLKPRSGPRAWS